PKADPLREKGPLDSGASGAGRRCRLVADPLQLDGHLLGQALDGARAEEVWRVAPDKGGRIAGAERIAMDIGDGRPGAVVTGPEMALGARLGVGSRRPGRCVIGPFSGTGQIGARHASEPQLLSDMGTSALDGLEGGGEEFVAGIERPSEGLLPLTIRDERDELRLVGVTGPLWMQD